MRSIKGYERLYAVTRDGRIWSYSSNKWLTITKGKRGKGYMFVQLWKNNKGKAVYVHQLVAKTYIGNPENKKTVNYKDGNVENNHFTDLEWATHQEQQDHAWKIGLTNNYGERCGTAKIKNSQADDLIALYMLGTKLSQYELAAMFGINQSQVSRILNGKRRAKQHKGKRNEPK